MIKSLKIFVIVFVVLFTGCKSVKSVSNSGVLDSKITSKELIRAHKKQDFKFKTLQSKVKVEYAQGNKSQSYSINLRMEKDKTIWMSKLGFVKVLITPERVSFYNKLDNTYFDGDYAYLSDLLGTALDFNKVQNLLLGEALYDLDKDKFEIFTQENEYVLKPKTQPDAFELFYLLNASHFKINSQQLAQSEDLRMLQIDYINYQEVDKQTFPENIKINAVEGYEETILAIEFKTITLNEKVSFPFKIPSGYDQIVLE